MSADALVHVKCLLDFNVIIYESCPTQIHDLIIADATETSNLFFGLNFLFHKKINKKENFTNTLTTLI
jgi:hypothetical protein